MAGPGMGAAGDASMLLRELHHRVKNNFQIIASLINLKKRTAAPTQQEDLRFLEEHVMVMAAAHRLVFASRSMLDVDLTDLVIETAEGLRVVAGMPGTLLSVQAPRVATSLPLDQAIALGLYLAVTLPPYLNHAAVAKTRVALHITHDPPGVEIVPEDAGGNTLDALRQRLMEAYVRQLGPSAVHRAEEGRQVLTFKGRK